MSVVVLDANALIDYTRERARHECRHPPTRPAAEMLRRCLGPMLGEKRVLVPRTAYAEAYRNLQKDIEEAFAGYDYDEIRDYAYALLADKLARIVVPDVADHVEDARAMYAAIAADPSDPRLAEWRRVKGRHRDAPRLGPGRGDLAILSTAAHYARSGGAELWTRDADLPCLRERYSTGSAWM